MLSDMEMIVHRFPKSKTLTIIPVADVHLGALEHNAHAWESFCKEVIKQPDTYLLLVGDLINNSTRSSVANPFDEVIRPREQKKLMVEHLKPLAEAGRILCSVSGNHERRSLKESDVDLSYDIMSKLDIEDVYRENAAFLKICLGNRPCQGAPECTFAFVVTHGAGGGIYTGAAVNRNERFGNVIEGLDCLIVGHTHKGTVSRPSKIVIDAKNEKVSMRSYTVVSAESWLNYGGYAAQKMLLPSETANPQRIYLHGNRDRKYLEVRW
jgi:UDP-2,3-diacylglucosamine pyrophosphatase LpxH